MRAAVCTAYGSPEVLKIKEVETPNPKNNEVLIKIFATTVTSACVRIRSSTFPFGFGFLARLGFGFRRPRNNILGTELAGEVESVGKDVKLFKKGDQVFGGAGIGLGTYAEYKCLPEDGVITIKPTNKTYEEVAGVAFGGMTALYFLKKANIQKGQKVLIYGASGAIGTYAVQLAKHFGAEVTAVCSTTNLGLVKSLGADNVVDYTKEDFTNNVETYDVIFETVGKTTFSLCKNALKEKGIYLAALLDLPQHFPLLWRSTISSKKMLGGMTSEPIEDLISLKDLIESGEIKSVVDRSYPLEEIVEAHKYVEKGHKKGNVVITMEHNSKS